jgi:hypothetical protein
MVSLAIMEVTEHKCHNAFFVEKVISNGRMKPVKLKAHLTPVHPEYASKDAVLSCEETQLELEESGTFPSLRFAISKKKRNFFS